MPDTASVELVESLIPDIESIIAKYPNHDRKSALLPVLHLVQDRSGGHLSQALMDSVASVLGLAPIEVYEVATFYSMFNLSPVGDHVFEVCQTGPCCLMGAERIIDHIQKRLNISVGQTTPDGKFTLKAVECLASCGTAPVMAWNHQYLENLTPDRIDELLISLGASW